MPKIASRLSYDKMFQQPELTCYLRKNDDHGIPFAVGEFCFTLFRYVFIVPLSNKDENDFLTEDEYKIFWEKFKHYNAVGGWTFKDYSNNEKRRFVIKLNVSLNNITEETQDTDETH